MEEAERDIVDKLREKFPGAKVEPEYAGPMKFIINIEWPGFEGKSEEQRQEEIWGFLHENFEYGKLKYIGYISTWTETEKKAYALEDDG
jgi:hypothetical protein